MPAHDQHPEATKLATAVGFALAQWSIVEYEVASLFQWISGISDPADAHVIMGAIVSFEARVAVVHELMQRRSWPAEDLRVWNKLQGMLRAKHRERNQLAHFTILIKQPWVSDEAGRMVLVPFFSLGQQHMAKPRRLELSVREIHEREASFRALSEAVRWFGRTATRLKHPESAPPDTSAVIERIRQSLRSAADGRGEGGRPPNSDG